MRHDFDQQFKERLLFMSTSPRILTIMGSGETAPTMMKHHRELIARFPGTPKAVVLDTPYGFQENAAELASKAVEYFRKSVGHPIEIAGLTRLHGQDTLTVEQGLARVRQADYVFAGPGSPTYALRQWAGTSVPDIVRGKMRTGGAVTFASAAALTLGRYTVPVYEIYKVGNDPYWLEGLDVLGEIGLNVAVIPHYDNAEGGHHDTRFCYLGEHRLAMLEEQLPAEAHVIGVDEHTGVILDLDSNTATVIGNSTITVRIKGRSTIHNSGDVISIDALRDPATGATNIPIHVTPPNTLQAEPEKDSTSLANDTQQAERSFNDAMSSGDAAGAARAVLALESAIHAWSADTLQGEEMDNAHAALRSMIVRLGDAAIGGLADPRDALDPVMNVLLELRSAVRTDKRYDLSDLIRDRLAAVKIEVRDTPQGVEWVINS
jgi:cyanophycinase-like exopeptidase